jgi:hypothetical protein
MSDDTENLAAILQSMREQVASGAVRVTLHASSEMLERGSRSTMSFRQLLRAMQRLWRTIRTIGGALAASSLDAPGKGERFMSYARLPSLC